MTGSKVQEGECQLNLLLGYKEARRRHPSIGVRDLIASWAANGILRLASSEYRALMNESIHLGLLEIATKGNPNQPFTEPDDPEETP